MGETLTSIAILIFIAVAYFLPSIIANNRNHKNINSIMVLNILTGWTTIGWLIALIWSFTDNTYNKNS